MCTTPATWSLGPTEAFTSEEFAAAYDTNVLGTQRVNRAALPVLRAQGESLVLWIGSSSTRIAARDKVFRESGLDVTYLRPNTLMSNALWCFRAFRQRAKWSMAVTSPDSPGRPLRRCTDRRARID